MRSTRCNQGNPIGAIAHIHGIRIIIMLSCPGGKHVGLLPDWPPVRDKPLASSCLARSAASGLVSSLEEETDVRMLLHALLTKIGFQLLQLDY